MSGPPPPPPPQYTEEQEKPPDDWVPPPDLANDISNDPNISPIVKESITHDNRGPPPPPAQTTPDGDDDDIDDDNNNEYENNNNTYEDNNNNTYEEEIDVNAISPVPDQPVYDDYETGPPPAPNYDNYGMDDQTGGVDVTGGYSAAMLSTGNLLEDLDNMLRIYRVTINDIDRSKLFVEFWRQWDQLCTDQPKELLKIPTKVRGFLHVLPNITPYQADQIMKEVLSDGGLLAEPEYIERRYILKLFLIYEFGNIFSWIGSNITTLKVWMFIFSLTLSIAIITHVFVDFFSGNVWRALLMEFMVPLSLLSTAQFIDTPFFACVIRVMIEDNCSALATIPGRIFFNVIVVFFCLGSWESQDAAILVAAFFVGIMTFIIFVTYSRLMNTSAHVRILTGSSQKLEQKFLQYDTDRDGILNRQELGLFFQSFRQQMSNWQLEMMIMQYDIQRDNGLRFESMDIWFRKQPINADTRSQVLAAKSREFYGMSENNPANNGDTDNGGVGVGLSQQELEWKLAGLAGMNNSSNNTNDAQAHNLALSAMGV